MKKRCILVIPADLQKSLSIYLSEEHWLCAPIENWDQIASMIADFSPHVAMIDYSHASNDLGSFTTTLREIRAHSDHDIPILALYPPALDTREHQDLLSDIEGASFASIPSNANQRRIGAGLEKAFKAAQTNARLRDFSRSVAEEFSVHQFLGSSAKANNVREFIRLTHDIPITSLLITGETGTGKSAVARIIHHNGLRREAPLVELNCAAIPSDMLESQMFGHEAGAFTGAVKRHIGVMERADGGTLFLDEIGDMELDLQAKLLKAIEEQKITRVGGEREISIDIQILAATNSEMHVALSKHQFRNDLYHRLSVFSLNLPPLRKRKKDLLELVPHFVAKYNTRSKKRVSHIPDHTWDILFDHDWPGNIRELSNVIERCVLLSKGDSLNSDWLQLQNTSTTDGTANPTQLSDEHSLHIPLDGRLSFDEIEETIIRAALACSDHNVSHTARRLRMSREKLRYRIKKYKIQTGQIN